MFIARVGAFFSKLYSLKEHPSYADLYETWEGNEEKLYNHYIELKKADNEDYSLLTECGLFYANPIIVPKVEEVNEKEIRNVIKTGVIRLEDLKTEMIVKLGGINEKIN